jgi:hypothetical protein
MDKQLQEIFKNVNEWLKFSEAKNIFLLTFNTATFYFFLKYIYDTILSKNFTISYISILLLISSLLILINIIILLLSFLPVTKIEKEIFKNKERIQLKDNLIFYGDIIKYNSTEYLNKIYDSHKQEKPLIYPKNENDLSEQIITNSKIAMRKYILFTTVVKLDIFVILILPIISILIKFIILLLQIIV